MMKSEKGRRLIVLSTAAVVGLSATQIVVKSDELTNMQQPTVREGTVVAPEAPPLRVSDRRVTRRDRG